MPKLRLRDPVDRQVLRAMRYDVAERKCDYDVVAGGCGTVRRNDVVTCGRGRRICRRRKQHFADRCAKSAESFGNHAAHGCCATRAAASVASDGIRAVTDIHAQYDGSARTHGPDRGGTGTGCGAWHWRLHRIPHVVQW